MTAKSWNGLHKWKIVIFGITQNRFELKHQKYPGDGSVKQENF